MSGYNHNRGTAVRAKSGRTLAERLAFYSEPAANGCIIWKGAKNKKGYGSLTYVGKRHYVHRLVYELAFGPIPAGLCACHVCDNQSCLNPLHIFIGSKAANNADMRAKGRHAFGERNGCAKLTAGQVMAIRGDHRVYRVIANSFGVSAATVCLIKTGQVWKSIPGEHP